MRILVLILAIVFNFSFAEENIEKVKIPEEIKNQLGIKTKAVKRLSLKITKKYPAVIKDDLTLSQAVFSPIDGLIKKLFVKEGDKVKKGQKVALIYSPKIVELKSQLYFAKVQLDTAKQIFEREKKLYEEKVIPYSRFFKAKISYENAKGKYEAIEKSLTAYGELEENFVVLRSNIDGYVAKQNVVLGDSVGINKMLFKIHSHEKLWAIAFVPVKETILFKKGMYIDVLSPIGITKAVVDFISHSVDPDTKRVEIRAIADNTKETLKPNMFVDVVLSKTLPEKLYVPVSAVVFHENHSLVFVEKNREFFPVEIKVGKRINGFYEVLEGLKESQKVVVSGTIHLKAKFFGEAEEE